MQVLNVIIIILCININIIKCNVMEQPPFYPHYPTRKITNLDGIWNFGVSDGINKVDPITVNYNEMKTPNITSVPSAFDVTQPGVEGIRGTVYYRKVISLRKGREGLLYFAACSFYCRILIDGDTITDHRSGGYVGFWINVPMNVDKEEREITVVVNNEFNSTTAPVHTGGDFYNYGGITRNVILHELPDSSYYMKQVESFTEDNSKLIMLRIILNGHQIPSKVNLNLYFDSDVQPLKYSSVLVDNNVITLNHVMVPNAKLWSIKSPNLHLLKVLLLDDHNSIIDSILIRFGIRTLSIINGRLAINNEIIKLHGINHHTMYPSTGSALTLEQVLNDIKLLKELNANYVRLPHYPQDQRVLDLLDEVGIVAWEETLGPGTSVFNLTNEYFLKYQKQQLNEMIDSSINHPSVILYGFYNEGPSDDPKSFSGYNFSASIIRERVYYNSRLVTWASNKKDKDVCLSLADVISFNGYPGWYTNCCSANVTAYWLTELDWVMKNYPSKAFTISECGAGGVYEWTNTTAVKWSQQYQSDVIKNNALFAKQHDHISGITIWQFNDIKANSIDTLRCGSCDYLPHKSLKFPWTCAYINVNCDRPGGENHKGVVDFWRRKKESFHVLSQIYANF